MKKVHIVVRQGLIQAVYAEHGLDVDVEIHDLDVDNEEEWLEADKEFFDSLGEEEE